MITIAENIHYIPCSENPLSADIGIITTNRGIWLYDVGAEPRAVTLLQGRYHVVLSHFHTDHTANLNLLQTDSLYVSGETGRHTHRGTVVTKDIYIDTLHIFPLPSSHCKGCLGLEVDEAYAFVGDGLYSRVKDDYYIFNAQLVHDEIAVLKQLKAPDLLVSHYPGLIRSRLEVIAGLEELYSLRKKGEMEIRLKR